MSGGKRDGKAVPRAPKPLEQRLLAKLYAKLVGEGKVKPNQSPLQRKW